MRARKTRALPKILMLFAAFIIACDSITEPIPVPTVSETPVSACPGYAIPSNCPPFPTGGENVISGLLLERTSTGTRPVAGGGVWAFVQLPNRGYSAGRVDTNTTGEFRFPLLPNAIVILQGGGGKYDQPCASVVELSTPVATANIEVVSEDAPIVDPAPPPPALRGVVYEVTASGKQPVPHARVFFESAMEVVVATTTTDESGRYSMCRLPSFSSIVTPVKSGYVLTGKSVSVTGVMEMDLEMKRQ